jgi:hypothetical protein
MRGVNVLGGTRFERAWRVLFWAVVLLAAIVVGGQAILG